MCGSIERAAVAGDRHHRVGLADADRGAATLVVVVCTAGERPARRSARCVGEARSQCEYAARCRRIARDTRGRTGRAMCGRIERAAVAGDRHHRVGLADRDGRSTVLVVVVRPAGERPVRRSARCVGEARSQCEYAARRRRIARDTRHRACRAMCGRIERAAVAGDRHHRVGLADDDPSRATLVVVVRAAGERPARRPAGRVGETGAQRQRAPRRGGIARDTHRRARRAVCRRIERAAVAGDRHHRVGLADRDGRSTTLVVVVRAAGERPVRRSARCVGEARSQREYAARRRRIARDTRR
jgi:hypothetical protein